MRVFSERTTERLMIRLCHRLPSRLRYWVVVDAVSRASWRNPLTEMHNLQPLDLLNAIDFDEESPETPKTWRTP